MVIEDSLDQFPEIKFKIDQSRKSLGKENSMKSPFLSEERTINIQNILKNAQSE